MVINVTRIFVVGPVSTVRNLSCPMIDNLENICPSLLSPHLYSFVRVVLDKFRTKIINTLKLFL